MTFDPQPIRADELDGLFAALLPDADLSRAALAVSGGSDSTALMFLIADWLRAAGRPTASVTVLTVDHGLRPESRAEAKAVARQAAGLGLTHAILAWDGPKPSTGLQEAARSARYRLIAHHMRARGLQVLLTAHTADDQAETLLMRLARGSGLDGLAAMALVAALDAGAPHPGAPLKIVRPLLQVPKARLVATLEQRGVAWIEDPSNQSPAFERVRLRAVAAGLAAAGLTPQMLGLSAQRLRRARAALEDVTRGYCDPALGRVQVEACGVIRLDRAAFRAAPAEIGVRVLSLAIAATGGVCGPVPLAGVEAIAEKLVADTPGGAWTLARAMLKATGDTILLEREPGREPLPGLIANEQWALWDGRFWVRARAALAGPIEVRALGAEGLSLVHASGAAALPSKTSTTALRAVPAFWRDHDLLAVPSLDLWLDGPLQPVLSAQFRGLASPISAPAG